MPVVSIETVLQRLDGLELTIEGVAAVFSLDELRGILTQFGLQRVARQQTTRQGLAAGVVELVRSGRVGRPRHPPLTTHQYSAKASVATGSPEWGGSVDIHDIEAPCDAEWSETSFGEDLSGCNDFNPRQGFETFNEGACAMASSPHCIGRRASVSAEIATKDVVAAIPSGGPLRAPAGFFGSARDDLSSRQLARDFEPALDLDRPYVDTRMRAAQICLTDSESSSCSDDGGEKAARDSLHLELLLRGGAVLQRLPLANSRIGFDADADVGSKRRRSAQSGTDSLGLSVNHRDPQVHVPSSLVMSASTETVNAKLVKRARDKAPKRCTTVRSHDPPGSRTNDTSTADATKPKDGRTNARASTRTSADTQTTGREGPVGPQSKCSDTSAPMYHDCARILSQVDASASKNVTEVESSIRLANIAPLGGAPAPRELTQNDDDSAASPQLFHTGVASSSPANESAETTPWLDSPPRLTCFSNSDACSKRMDSGVCDSTTEHSQCDGGTCLQEPRAQKTVVVSTPVTGTFDPSIAARISELLSRPSMLPAWMVQSASPTQPQQLVADSNVASLLEAAVPCKHIAPGAAVCVPSKMISKTTPRSCVSLDQVGPHALTSLATTHAGSSSDSTTTAADAAAAVKLSLVSSVTHPKPAYARAPANKIAQQSQVIRTGPPLVSVSPRASVPELSVPVQTGARPIMRHGRLAAAAMAARFGHVKR